MKPNTFLSQYAPQVRTLAVIRAITAFGFSLTMPFLALYLHQELKVSLTMVGVMLTITGICGSLASSFGGALSDRYGRRKLLINLTLARGLIFFVLAFLVWHHESFLIFSIVYVLAGIFGTATFPIMDAIVADVTTPKERADSYGLLRVAMNAAWAFGPAIGGLIITGGYYLLFIATGVMLGAASFTTRMKISETGQSESVQTGKPLPFAILKTDPSLSLFMLVCLLLFLVKGQLVATLSVHMAENVGVPKNWIGFIYFMNGAMVALFLVPMTKIVNRFEPLKALVVSGLFYGLGYLLVGLATSVIDMFVAVAIITIGELIEAPTATAYASILAPQGLAGTYLGVFNMVVHIGWTAGPLIGGLLLDHMNSPMQAWFIIVSLALCSSAGFMILQKRKSVIPTTK